MWIAMDHGRSFKRPVQGNPRTADQGLFIYIYIYIIIEYILQLFPLA